MKLHGPISSGAAAGGAGVATANATTTTAIVGLIAAVYVDYQDSPPAGTTDVTIATAGTDAPANTILTLTNAATDGWFYPRHAEHDNTGSALATYTPVPIHDKVKVTIAQANNNDYVEVYLLLVD